MSAATDPDPLPKQRAIVGHIDTPERSNEPIYADATGRPRGDHPCDAIPGSNSGDSKLQDLRREEEMARQTYARLLFRRLDYEKTVKTQAGDPEPGDTDARPVEAPPLPQSEQDKSVSPFDMGDHWVEQVEKAEQFLQWCRWAIDKADQYMEGSTPDVQDKIQEVLRELAERVKEGARVKAIGEGSLEVAAPLYLFFEVIIPVM